MFLQTASIRLSSFQASAVSIAETSVEEEAASFSFNFCSYTEFLATMVFMYSILNPRTFPSAIACFIIY